MSSSRVKGNAMHPKAVSRLDALRQYRGLLRQDYPEPTLRNLKRRFCLLLHGLRHLALLQRWYGSGDTPLLREVLGRYPHIRGAIYWPYLSNAWSPERRFQVIVAHYRLLDGPAVVLRAVIEGDLSLTTLPAGASALRFVLDKPKWFMREGEVVLNIFQGEMRLYSVAFTLGLEGGERVIYLGAIQGSNQEQANAIYRQLTRDLEGMRPRDLMIAAMRMLGGALGIDRLLAVSHAACIYESAYFGDLPEEKIQADYDQIWSEQGGRLLENGFFEIPTAITYRDLSEVPSKKRAAYRRRYQMLDDLRLRIQEACASPPRRGQ